MSIPGKVQVTGVLAPTDSADTFPVTDPQYGLGALRTVVDQAAMNAITDQRRQQGMLVYVVEDLAYYMLNAPPWDGTLDDWTVVAIGVESSDVLEIGEIITNGPVDGSFLVVGSGGVLDQVGEVTQDQVTHLVSDLALKAPTDSPVFTGTPTAPTPLIDDSSTRIATTEFVFSQDYLTGNELITFSGDGVGSGTVSIPITVVGLYNHAVSSIVPTDGQVLTWVASTSKWTPLAVISSGGAMAIGGTIANSPVAGDTLVIGSGGVLAQTSTMVTSDTGSPLTLKSSGTPGTYTATNSGIFMYNGSGVEMLRIVTGDPDSDNDSSLNLFIGCQAGFTLPSTTPGAGGSNIGIGVKALYTNKFGFLNMAIGSSSLYDFDGGGFNIALGASALESLPSGNYNTAIGCSSMNLMDVDCTENTALGYNSGNSLFSGDHNTFIGSNTGVDSGVDGISNVTVLGWLTTVSDSNRVVIGNDQVTDVYCGSEFALATVRAAAFIGDGSLLTGVSGSSSPPGGASGSIQFNSSGSFGGFGSWDGTTLLVPVFGPHGSTRVTSNSGAFDLAVGDWFFRTLDGTNGTFTVTNEKVGQIFTLELLQDSTGSRAVVWTSLGTIIWMTSGGTAPPIASGANLRTTLLFKRISAGNFLGWLTGSQA